eukprot:5604046-Prymnesium_polylepis.1
MPVNAYPARRDPTASKARRLPHLAPPPQRGCRSGWAQPASARHASRQRARTPVAGPAPSARRASIGGLAAPSKYPATRACRVPSAPRTPTLRHLT